MTDGRVWLTEDGKESVAFYRGDGYGIERLKAAGVQVVVISAERVPIVAHRCRKLGIDGMHGVSDKLRALEGYCLIGPEYALSEVAYVGNDLNDLDCLRAVGFPFAPNDCEPALWREHFAQGNHFMGDHIWLNGAKRVGRTDRSGGRGAVREVCDLIIAAKEAARAHD